MFSPFNLFDWLLPHAHWFSGSRIGLQPSQPPFMSALLTYKGFSCLVFVSLPAWRWISSSDSSRPHQVHSSDLASFTDYRLHYDCTWTIAWTISATMCWSVSVRLSFVGLKLLFYLINIVLLLEAWFTKTPLCDWTCPVLCNRTLSRTRYKPAKQEPCRTNGLCQRNGNHNRLPNSLRSTASYSNIADCIRSFRQSDLNSLRFIRIQPFVPLQLPKCCANKTVAIGCRNTSPLGAMLLWSLQRIYQRHYEGEKQLLKVHWSRGLDTELKWAFSFHLQTQSSIAFCG